MHSLRTNWQKSIRFKSDHRSPAPGTEHETQSSQKSCLLNCWPPAVACSQSQTEFAPNVHVAMITGAKRWLVVLSLAMVLLVFVHNSALIWRRPPSGKPPADGVEAEAAAFIGVTSPRPNRPSGPLSAAIAVEESSPQPRPGDSAAHRRTVPRDSGAAPDPSDAKRLAQIHRALATSNDSATRSVPSPAPATAPSRHVEEPSVQQLPRVRSQPKKPLVMSDHCQRLCRWRFDALPEGVAFKAISRQLRSFRVW